jgi:hypothetical protein
MDLGLHEARNSRDYVVVVELRPTEAIHEGQGSDAERTLSQKKFGGSVRRFFPHCATRVLIDD